MTTLVNNRYELQDKLGAGGMGEVYRAYDRLTGATVALKLVQADDTLPDDRTAPDNITITEAVQRRVALAREFQVLASLRHPHIISVLDYGFGAIGGYQDHQPYLTMELLSSGEHFLHYGDRIPDLEGKLTLTLQLLEALSYLHRHSILHRDLKPANVLVLPDGRLKVLDFGIAAEVGKEEAAAGTLLYMAPEILSGDPPQRASDLYAVGVMLYELLIGRHPFVRDASWETINAVLNEEPDLNIIQKIETTAAFDLQGAVEAAEVRDAAPDTTRPVMPDLDQTIIPGRTVTLPTPPADSGDDSEQAGDAAGTDQPDHDVTRRSPLVDHERTLALGDLDDLGLTPPQQTAADAEQKSDVRLKTSERGILSDVLAHLLAKKPEQRYDHAGQVINLLEQVMGRPPSESSEIRESYLQAARFVGRESELNLLEEGLVSTISGHGAAWLVGGESGVGKSRLLDELRSRALVRNVQVLRGQMIERGGVPYQLWREPLRRLLLISDIDDRDAAVLRDLVPDIETLLRRRVKKGPAVDAGAYQQRLFGIVSNLIRRARTPVLLLLEDLQWAAESLTLLNHITGLIHDLPVMIVATYRHDERPTLPDEVSGVQTMKLDRLSREDVAALSQSILGEAGSQPEIVTYLHRETEGNIFFMVEMIRALADEAGRLEKITAMSLPPGLVVGGISAVLQRRLASLSAEDQPLLRLAAVYGRELNLQVLEQFESVRTRTAPGLQDWLARASNCAVLEVRNEIWQFAHEKLRGAILDSVIPAERVSLHEQVARAMEAVHGESPQHAAAIAHHWRQAGDVEREFVALERAAAYALRIGVFSEAKADYERALSLVRTLSLPERERDVVEARLLWKAGETAYYLDDYVSSMSLLEKALELYRGLKDDAGIVQVLNTLADVRWRQGEYTEARKHCDESLSLARQIKDPAGEARALNRLGMVNVEQGDYTAAQTHLENSVQIAQALHDATLTINPVNNLAVVAFAHGDYDAAEEHLQRTLALSREIGDRLKTAVVLGNLGGIAGSKSDFDSATRYFEESLELCRAMGNRQGEAFALSNLGTIAELKEDFPQALRYLQSAYHLSEQIGNRLNSATTLTGLGAVARLMEETALARDYYRKALALAVELDAQPIMMDVLVGLAQIAIMTSEVAEKEKAVRWLGLVLAHAATVEDTRKLAEPALAELRTGFPPDQFEQLLEQGQKSTLTQVAAVITRDAAPE